MKNKLLLSFLLAFLLFLQMVHAQQTSFIYYNEKELVLTQDTFSRFILFTGIHYEKKTYLHWDVVCQHQDGLYLVYKSSDDKHYQLLGHKKGIGIPLTLPIAYYFQDETPEEGTTYYQVVHVTKDKTYLVSDKIAVIRPPNSQSPHLKEGLAANK